MVVERPSGRLELFPSGRFITRGELASRRLTEPSPPAIEVLDTAEGKVIRLASGLSLLVTKTERIEFDPSTWLVAWDGTSASISKARALSISTGSWAPTVATVGDPGVLLAGPKVVGDFFAGANLWRLPEFTVVATPDRANKSGRDAIRWVVANGVAVALEGIPGGNGISDWALEVWKLGDKEDSRVIPIDVRNDVDVALSSDGTLLAVSHGDLELLDTNALKRRVLLKQEEVEPGGRLAFSPDSTTLCVRSDRGSRAFAVGSRATPAQMIEMPLAGDVCGSVAVPPAPSGRAFLTPYADSTNGPYAGGAMRNDAGDLVALIDQTSLKGVSPTREFSVRLLRAGGTVAADLSYACHYSSVATGLRFDESGLVVGDVEHEASCGGRVDLQSMKWKQLFGESQSKDARATQAASDSKAVTELIAALGPAPEGGEWFGPACSPAECWPTPSGGPQITRQYVAAASSPGARVLERRFGQTPPSSASAAAPSTPATAVDFYDGWFTVTRRTDGHVLATAVRVGDGAVALLSGGAVDVRGAVPEGALFCRVGTDLRPWSECRDRYLVRSGLEPAIQGREDYLQ